jgi:hypothetical protein
MFSNSIIKEKYPDTSFVKTISDLNRNDVLPFLERRKNIILKMQSSDAVAGLFLSAIAKLNNMVASNADEKIKFEAIRLKNMESLLEIFKPLLASVITFKNLMQIFNDFRKMANFDETKNLNEYKLKLAEIMRNAIQNMDELNEFLQFIPSANKVKFMDDQDAIWEVHCRKECHNSIIKDKYSDTSFVKTITDLNRGDVLPFLERRKSIILKMQSADAIAGLFLAAIAKLNIISSIHADEKIEFEEIRLKNMESLLEIFKPLLASVITFEKLMQIAKDFERVSNFDAKKNTNQYIIKLAEIMRNAIGNLEELTKFIGVIPAECKMKFMDDQDALWEVRCREECRVAFLSGGERPEASNFLFFNPPNNANGEVVPGGRDIAKRILEEAELGPMSTGGKFTR